METFPGSERAGKGRYLGTRLAWAARRRLAHVARQARSDHPLGGWDSGPVSVLRHFRK
jgi:hypothetical protein